MLSKQFKVTILVSALNLASLSLLAAEPAPQWQKYTDSGTEAFQHMELEKAERFYAAAFSERKKLPPYKDLLTAGYDPKMLMSTHNLDEVSMSLLVQYEEKKQWQKLANFSRWILSDSNHVRLSLQASTWTKLAKAQLNQGKAEEAKKCFNAFHTIQKQIEPRINELNSLDLGLLTNGSKEYAAFFKNAQVAK